MRRATNVIIIIMKNNKYTQHVDNDDIDVAFQIIKVRVAPENERGKEDVENKLKKMMCKMKGKNN